MKIQEVRKIAKDLMEKHGLVRWQLKFNNSKSYAGLCRYGYWNLNPRLSWGTIELSTPYMEAFDEYNVVDTILHEIAHALTKERGHGKEWKAVARRIGCSAERTVSHDAPKIKSRYRAVCPNGHEIARHRLTSNLKNSSCPQCSSSFSREYMFDIYDNGVLVHRRPVSRMQVPSISVAGQWIKPKPKPSKAPMTAEEWAREHSPELLRLLQGIE